VAHRCDTGSSNGPNLDGVRSRGTTQRADIATIHRADDDLALRKVAKRQRPSCPLPPGESVEFEGSPSLRHPQRSFGAPVGGGVSPGDGFGCFVGGSDGLGMLSEMQGAGLDGAAQGGQEVIDQLGGL